MTDTELHRMADAAIVIRRVTGSEFDWEQPNLRKYGRGAIMTLLHEPGSNLRPYCDYDCREYDKIEALADALAEVDLFVEDCTGDYSAVYERGA